MRAIPDRRGRGNEQPPRRLITPAVIVGLLSLVTDVHAQIYPWCSNFADGAGTNCGWSTQEQCRLTVQGSGGYCSYNNLYKPPPAAAPARHAVLKRRHGEHS
jgi:hypothetical protein